MERHSVRISDLAATRVELEKIYLEYFAYPSARERRGETVPGLSESKSKHAEGYCRVILHLSRRGERDRFDEVVQRSRERFASEMRRLKLPVSDWGRDGSWASWDLAKQLYFFLDVDAKADSRYRIASFELTNPLTDGLLLEEIVSRHVGWEVELLALQLALHIGEPRIEELLEGADYASSQSPPLRASWALAELGGLIRASQASAEIPAQTVSG